MLKIDVLPEPNVVFGNGHTGIEPRLCLAKNGPADGGSVREVRLGLVGAAEDIEAAKAWLKRLNGFRPACENNSARYRDWPGAPAALGVQFKLEERFIRPVDSSRLGLALLKAPSRERFDELIELFAARIAGLLGDGSPHCIVVCLPEELADLRIANPGLTAEERTALEQLRREEESDQMALFAASPEEIKAAEELRSQAEDLLFRTFYRALKARGQNHLNPVPIQVLRRETVDRPDDKGHSHATRCWNIAVSLYYKAGGLPWRPAELPDNVCFVGISFHHLKKRSASLVYASVAQAFSNDVEPFTLKGAHIDHDQREDRQPYLNFDQSHALLNDVIHQYESRAGLLPSRIVLHKTSTYHPEEQRGFREATHGRVPTLEMIWLRSTSFRLVRRGLQEPWRGTLCSVGSETYLFTSGYIPWWNEYPGPHIPAPIQIGSMASTDLKQRAKEILALSKMNWNNTEGISRYPITLSFAKRVGQLMPELPDNQDPNPSYRFHM